MDKLNKETLYIYNIKGLKKSILEGEKEHLEQSTSLEELGDWKNIK